MEKKEFKKKYGNPEIVSFITGKLDISFLRCIADRLNKDRPNLCQEEKKEKNLKIEIISHLLENIEDWLKENTKISEYEVPLNPCIATELSLPYLPEDDTELIESLPVQDFSEFKCDELRYFMPPTDICINATSWISDPIFAYSLLVGIELKVFKKTSEFYKKDIISFEKDIKKAILYLRYCKKSFEVEAKSEREIYNYKYKHITNGKEIFIPKFFLLYICCSDAEGAEISIALNKYNEKINLKHIYHIIKGSQTLNLIEINLKV